MDRITGVCICFLDIAIILIGVLLNNLVNRVNELERINEVQSGMILELKG